MILKKGDKGSRVKEIQRALEIIPDGDFGPKTEAKVKEFQAINGLVADGIVGPKTYAIILEDANTDLKSLDVSNDVDGKLAEHGSYMSGDLEIDRVYLDSDEYVRDYGKIEPIQFMIHHTAGWNSPYATISSWNRDKRGRVGTQYVIGGINIKTGDTKYDGVVVECFPDNYLAWHTGKVGNFTKVSKLCAAVEICNFGYVEKINGKFYNYVNIEVPSDWVVDLGYKFRGHQYWHKYSDAQIESLRQLISHVKKIYPKIDITNGLPKLLKEGVHPKDAFEFNEDCFNGKSLGTWSHTNIRSDKFDCFPQPELVEMLKGL